MADPNMSTEGGPVEAKAPTGPIPKWTPPVDPRTGKKAKMIPVWDPEEKALRGATPEQARELAEAGWTVGGDAQNEALNHSPLARTAAGLMAYSNAVNGNITDAALSSTEGGKKILKASNKVRSDNAGANFAGSLAGVATAGAVGGFAGGLSKGILEGAAAKGTAAKWGAKALDIGLQGAPYMAVQGAMDAVTEANLLNHPITAQQVAAGSLHSVIDGAGINLVTHGIIHAPAGIRKGIGNSLDHLEKWSLLPRESVEVPGSTKSYTTRGPVNEYPIEPPIGSQPNEPVQPGMAHGPMERTAFQLPAHVEEPSIEDMGRHPGHPTPSLVPSGTDLSAEMAAPSAMGESSMVGQLGDNIDAHPAPNMSEIAPEPVPPMAPGDPEAPILGGPREPPPYIPPHYPEYQPPIPKVRKPIREPSALSAAREQVAKHGTSAELAEFDAAHARELADSLPVPEKAVIGKANAPEVKAVHPADMKPEDADFEFTWRKQDKPKARLEKIRELMHERLADAGEEAQKLWERNLEITDEIEAIKGTKDYPNQREVLKGKYDLKKVIKAQLHELAPRVVDKEAGVIKPGFTDYNDEYRRIVRGANNSGKDIPKPLFGSKGADAAESSAKLHETLVAEQEAAAHRSAQAAAKDAEDAAAKARTKHQDALRKLERLEKDFAVKKADEEAYRAENDVRDEVLAKRGFDSRLKRLKHGEQGALTKREWKQKVAQEEWEAARPERERQAKLKADRDARRDAREIARDEERAAKKISDAAEAKAKVARNQQKAAEKVAKDAKKAAEAAEKKAATDAKAASNKEYKSDKTVREYTDHEGRKTETTERHVYKDKVRTRVTVKVNPHAQHMPGKYKVRWTGSDFSNVAKAGFYTGMYGPAKVAAGLMGAHNAFVHMANNRKVVGEAWQKFAGSLAKGIGSAYRLEARANKTAGRPEALKDAINPKHYDEVAQIIGYLNENPEVISTYTQQNYPGLAKSHPEFLNAVAVNMQKGVNEISQVIPKKPFSPTLQNAPFSPTRAQKVAVLRMWQAMGNPDLAIAFGDHTVFNSLDKVYPELQDSNRQQILQHIQNTRTPIRGRKARQLSQFVGAPVRPQDEAQALKRLQQTAGPEPMKQQGGRAGGVSKPPHSASISTQAVQREMPTGGMYQLGG